MVADYVALNEVITAENSRAVIAGKRYDVLLIDDPMELHKVGVASTKDLTAGEPVWAASTNMKAQEVTVDISSLTTGYIQLFAVASWTATVNATKVWLT